MSLRANQRSKSAPQPLSSKFPTAPAKVGEPSRASPLGKPDAGGQDPFNLDGFFPRTSSYYALHLTSSREDNHAKWMYATAEQDESQDLLPPSSDQRTSSSSSMTPDAAFPTTPGAGLSLFDDKGLQRHIQNEDRVGGIAHTALAAATELGKPAFREPSYEHDHIFHSYDHLHNTFCAKRRSATVADFSKLVPTTTRRSSNAERTIPIRIPSLFSPVEEKLDVFGTDDEDGKEQAVNEGGSWVTYIYQGAIRMWIRRSEA